MVQLLWGFSQAAGQAGLNAVAASYYPPYVRATGVGWALGIGRLRGIVAPMFGGMALSAGYSFGTTFSLISAPISVVGILLFILFSRRSGGDDVETRPPRNPASIRVASDPKVG